MILAGLIAARFAHYTALLLLFGAAAFTLFAAPREDGASQLEPRSPAFPRRLLLWSSVATLLTALLVLALTAANLTGDLSGATDLPVLLTILLDTDFGRVWLFRLAAAAALATSLALAWRRPGSRPAAWLTLIVAGALLTTVALTGHAQTRTDLLGWVHRAADAMHLVAAAVWLGALPPFLVLLARPAREDALRTGCLLVRFHTVGTLAVVALLLSGLVNSAFLVGEVGALLTTPYGRLLLVKLALFAVMVGLAADNRLRLVPRLNAALAAGAAPDRWLAGLRAHIRAEFLLGMGVLLAVAALGVMAPAADAGAR